VHFLNTEITLSMATGRSQHSQFVGMNDNKQHSQAVHCYTARERVAKTPS